MEVVFTWENKAKGIRYKGDNPDKSDIMKMGDEEFASITNSIFGFGYSFTQNWFDNIMVIILDGEPDQTINQFFYDLSEKHRYDLCTDVVSSQESLPEYFTLSEKEED